MANWEKLFRSLGFTESESKLYLTSLEQGEASVQSLAKAASISRVTAYAAIESLMGHGLMSSVQKGKKKLYVAESPERIVSHVQGHIQKMETTLREVRGGLSDLQLLKRGEKPVVKLFEGPEALKAIQDDVIATKPSYYDEFGNIDVIRALYPFETRKDFFQALAKLRPRARMMMVARTGPTISVVPGQQIKTLPPNLDFGGDIFVYGDKVALSTFRGKQISVLIESAELAKTFAALFDYLWECLGKEKSSAQKK
jgi:HTH-type transcriptional regulator, sugar sensing transcriptional regulator